MRFRKIKSFQRSIIGKAEPMEKQELYSDIEILLDKEPIELKGILGWDCEYEVYRRKGH